VPALSPYIIEPIWEQLVVLLPERQTSHPLSCHRPRIPDRAAFDKLVQVLVFGCAYEKIARSGLARPPRSGADVTSGSWPGCSTPCARWRSKPTIGWSAWSPRS
jgi:hypothetical protein